MLLLYIILYIVIFSRNILIFRLKYLTILVGIYISESSTIYPKQKQQNSVEIVGIFMKSQGKVIHKFCVETKTFCDNIFDNNMSMSIYYLFARTWNRILITHYTLVIRNNQFSLTLISFLLTLFRPTLISSRLNFLRIDFRNCYLFIKM